ncbi:MAG: glucosaminidase domain-containing protein [Erysipelotrichaceae bacterium]|nr:glucosaminidase domain-containing protein [Erysipelotrichaceae bacterium]
MKLIIKLCLVFTFIVFLATHALALEYQDIKVAETFDVVSFEHNTIIEVGSYRNYQQAFNRYQLEINNYENISIIHQGKVLKMEYGIVAFEGASDCSYNVEFKNVYDSSNGYVNACYGKDAAYLDSDASTVTFMIAGTIGKGKHEDVTLIPYEWIPNTISNYIIKDNFLYHQIKTNLNNEHYGSTIQLDFGYEGMQEGVLYYSYDNHYFYDDFFKMIDDYRLNTNQQSINKDNPYFNYYQYLPHRSISNYQQDEVADFFYKTLHIDGKLDHYLDLDRNSVNDIMNRSQYYQELAAFFKYQYQFGTNALMMLSLSMNETGSGRSSLSYTRNNLFGHAAYDSDVEKNASRYLSIAKSIYAHSKFYINASYANPNKFQYRGSFFGDKASGMNVMYASDPYWGEKAAMYYFKLDQRLGLKDYQSNALAITKSKNPIKVYEYASIDSNVMYRSATHIQGFNVIGIENEFYKVYLDPSIHQDYSYDFASDVGYIHSQDVLTLLNPEQINEEEFVRVTFHAEEGTFIDGSQIASYHILKGHKPSIDVPILEGHEFIGYDQQIQVANEDMEYHASYRKIKDIKMHTLPRLNYDINSRIDLKNGSIYVEYEDGSSNIIPLDTTMVTNFNLKQLGLNEVIVNYHGVSTSYIINVGDNLEKITADVKDSILQMIEEYSTKEALSKQDIEQINHVKLKYEDNMDLHLSFDELRKFDAILLKANRKKANFLVSRNKLDVQISGLALNVPFIELQQNNVFKNTIKLKVKKVNSAHHKKLIQLIEGYEFTPSEAFDLELAINLKDKELKGVSILQIKKPEIDRNVKFQMYYTNGIDIYQLPTSQSHQYVTCKMIGSGSYLLAYQEVSNPYVKEDLVENLSVKTSDIDLIQISINVFVVLLSILILLIVGLLIGKVLILKKQYIHYVREKNKHKRH